MLVHIKGLAEAEYHDMIMRSNNHAAADWSAALSSFEQKCLQQPPWYSDQLLLSHDALENFIAHFTCH